MGGTKMKFVSPIMALALAVALTSPVLAAKGSMPKGATHLGTKSAAAGSVISDIPRNQTECKKASGTWDDQTLTCKKGKL
jgi:hypothetical protein